MVLRSRSTYSVLSAQQYQQLPQEGGRALIIRSWALARSLVGKFYRVHFMQIFPMRTWRVKSGISLQFQPPACWWGYLCSYLVKGPGKFLMSCCSFVSLKMTCIEKVKNIAVYSQYSLQHSKVWRKTTKWTVGKLQDVFCKEIKFQSIFPLQTCFVFFLI